MAQNHIKQKLVWSGVLPTAVFVMYCSYASYFNALEVQRRKVNCSNIHQQFRLNTVIEMSLLSKDSAQSILEADYLQIFEMVNCLLEISHFVDLSSHRTRNRLHPTAAACG